MTRILTTTLATALMSVSTLAFAQGMAAPSTTPPAPAAAPAAPAPAPAPAAAPAPSDTAAPAPSDSSPAAAPADSDKSGDAAPASDTKPVKKHHHAMHAKGEGKQTPREVEETEALNKLESNGYNDFKDVKAEKGDVKATVMKDGKEEQVNVTKSGEIQGGSSPSDTASPPPAPPAPPSPPADNTAPPSTTTPSATPGGQ